jgi:DNA mismatch endonuclease (patch repair protein)
MSDVVSKSKRSAIMKAVKSSGNLSTELKLIKIFKKLRITGWRRNYKLLGRPDFVFPTKRVIVFVDGCFWHGHNCRNTHPSANRVYWENKIGNNKNRDKRISNSLKKDAWIVVRIWECEINNPSGKKLLAIKRITN